MTEPDRRNGELVFVATPIGNLGDLSTRARTVLERADVVCCEDTRRTRALLSAIGVSAGRRLLALHEHNEQSQVATVLGRVEEGDTVAVVSDAGTPGISDPGARVAAAASAAGLRVTAVPGPSAVLCALVVSGLPVDRFCMEGFLPRKGAERRRRLAVLAGEERTTVVLEAPGRLVDTLTELLEVCGDRPVAVARELTKLHEEIRRGSLSAVRDHCAAAPVRGEVVIVLGGAEPAPPPDDEDLTAKVRERLVRGEGVRNAAAAVAAQAGVSRRRVYELALATRDRDGEGAGPQAGPQV